MTAYQASLDLGLEQDLAAAAAAGDELAGGGMGRLSPVEPKGVVYTQPWVVDLILNLAGYRPELNLASLHVVEPSAGEGASLVPMVRRLIESVAAHGLDLRDSANRSPLMSLTDRRRGGRLSWWRGNSGSEASAKRKRAAWSSVRQSGVPMGPVMGVAQT